MDFLNISETISHLDLKRSDIVAEFGCGTADFSIALAKKLDKGRVYALDIQQEKLSVLEHKIAIQKLNNVKIIWCDLEAPNGSKLRNNFLQAILIPNALFQAENKYGIMQEAKRVLKSEGQLLIVDWSKPVAFGPKENLLNPVEVKKIASTLGFSLKEEFALGDYHYGLLFIK